MFSQSASGLVIACEGSDELACQAALREYDRDLRLVPQDSDHFGRRVYKVFRRVSENHSEFVCGWWDEFGKPYDGLSVTGLLDMVKRLDRNTRSVNLDPDTKNERLVERRRADTRGALMDVAEEFDGRLEGKRSSPLPRSRSLYLARSKARNSQMPDELKP